MREPITHVAIRFRGVIYSLPAPNRHHHVVRMIIDQTGVDSVDTHGEDQGFLDASGKYLRREVALVSALVNNQIKNLDDIRGNELFSEDVW